MGCDMMDTHLGSKGLDPAPVGYIGHTDHQAEVTDRVSEHAGEEDIRELAQEMGCEEPACLGGFGVGIGDCLMI